jgi:nudix-type nucleoside diphosphatase (YffH/AdpP family)
MKPEILDRKTVYKGYLTIQLVRVRLADGAIVNRLVEIHGNAVAVLPYDVVKKTAFIVRQFRPAVVDVIGGGEIEEACAGMIGDELPETAGRRESYEELGVLLGPLEFVACVWSSPGVSTERQWLYLAPIIAGNPIGCGGGLPGEHENISVVERSLNSLAADCRDARITDCKLLSLVLALQLRKPDLFSRFV